MRYEPSARLRRRTPPISRRGISAASLAACVAVILIAAPAEANGYECCPPEGPLPPGPYGTDCDGPVVVILATGSAPACAGAERECSGKQAVVIVDAGSGHCQGTRGACNDNTVFLAISTGESHGCTSGAAVATNG